MQTGTVYLYTICDYHIQTKTEEFKNISGEKCSTSVQVHPPAKPRQRNKYFLWILILCVVCVTVTVTVTVCVTRFGKHIDEKHSDIFSSSAEIETNMAQQQLLLAIVPPQQAAAAEEEKKKLICLICDKKYTLNFYFEKH
jgi:hypothetical protein